ncbi:hypothetical protein DL770_005037 [Monosporascus sp. CRB-9-2]|nr:hypothetical protein DL770_005037 [Monosporascus sp. CRB-9-2]
MKREVAILGGGSSGTYTAVRLQDSGKTVVVVEADDALGGHTETYTDPVTGQRDDIGVLFFHNIPVVRDYFARFDIPLEFAEKYGIQDAVPLLALYGQGGIDYEKTTTLYIVKYMGPTFVEGLSVGGLTTVRRHNQELYEAAYDALGSDNVLLSSTVSAAERSEKGVRLNVRIAGRHRRLPGRDRLQFNLPPLPGPLTITPSPIDGMTDVKYGSGFHEISAEEAQAAIIEDLAALTTAINSTPAEPQFVTFKAHTPFQPMVSNEDISDCFYKRLWGLQGRRQTYFTGAAWQSQDSALLWNFTEHRILPMLLK